MNEQEEYEAEIARLDSLKDTDHELDGAVRVKAQISRTQRDVLSLRIGADELTEVAAAASSKGQTVSEFIRDAALTQARAESKGAGRRWLDQPVAQALDELVKRVGEQEKEEKRRRRRPSSSRV